MAISQLNFNHTLAEGGRRIFSGKPCAFGFFGKWGSGEWGKWGSGGMGEFQLKPQHPKTRKPENPNTRKP
ncbi:MAG: hypothetical protein EWV63_08290 [Microcystis aeruginosa Ma_OC_H_19870700_S124]|uniref:Uncharacterized protein n=1 Tax=Microcystis aeruginosa Ma_OC_H_19870700_S124 TaxID=2486262 RepID=A0A552AQ66_MICAE|nr:MAG: hypothetical protein EWV63_08290 [Microcystis aeruginosa Ma_OC_H_19870700_S124]